MKRKIKNSIMILIILAIIGIGIGYAVLSQNLVLNGTAKTLSSKDWNIHFQNQKISRSSPKGSSNPQINLNESTLSGEFSATLWPDGWVTFYVDIVNDGKIDATASSSTITPVFNDPVAEEYIKCYVIKGGIDNDLLSGNSHGYTITLSYNPDKNTELPDTKINAKVTLNFDYEQK